MIQLDEQAGVKRTQAGVELEQAEAGVLHPQERVERARIRVERALERVAASAEGSEARWVVGGSSGLVLRGIDIGREPSDLDLYADEADASLLHARLAGYAVDTPHHSVTERYRSILSHYAIEGVPVELVGGFAVESEGSRYRLEVSDWLIAHGLPLEVGGFIIHIVPLSHELLFNLLREREDRAESIVRAAIQDGSAVSLANELEKLAMRNGIARAIFAKRLSELLVTSGGGAL